jgi:TRAP-type transport system periplasmic protein
MAANISENKATEETMIQRRTLLAAGGAALAAAPLRARAAKFAYKLGNNLPVTHPLNVRLQEAAARIREQTQGLVDIQIFPNNQLGGDTDMLSQVRSGAIQMLTQSGLIFSTLVPAASINGIGFAFRDYSQVWPAMDGPLGAHIRNAVGKFGLVAFEKIWDNGFRQTTTSTRPIVVPADFKGMKIRVPVSPLWTSMFQALGAAPASINFAETYSALQTRVVDGEENPLAVIEVAKLYEVQKYCSMTDHMWDGFWLLANARAFGALPQDAQAIVTREMNASAVQQREDVRKLNESLAGQLQSQGLAFNTPDPAPFRDALRQAGFYAQWKQKYGDEAWAILEKSVGALA